MSVEKLERKSGPVWRVRWRDENGQERSRVVGKKSDADKIDAEIKRAKRLGISTTLDAPDHTFGGFVAVWWSRYAVPYLTERTRKSYAGLWDRHLLPYLGATRVRTLTVDRVEHLQQDLRANGVGEPTIYRALVLLQSIMQRAVEWGYAPSNPVRFVRKPKVRRKRLVRPLPVAEVQAIIDRCKRTRDRLIVSLLANEGLRPQEILALDWHDFTDAGLVIEKAIDQNGEIKPTKNGVIRVVPLSDTTLSLVNQLYGEEGNPTPGRRVIRSTRGNTFTDGMWQSWHRDVWRKVRPSKDVRPYDLRHTFVSQKIAEGHNIMKIAKWAGHSPVMTMEVYGHLFDD